MSKKKPVDIEKIYVCKIKDDDSEIIEKVLIQYVNGNFAYFSLPSFYHKIKPNKQEKERKYLEKNLTSYMKKLSSQDNSSENYLENSKVVIIDDENIELKKYVDEHIERISNKDLISNEKVFQILGIFNTGVSAWSLMNANPIGFLLNNILSLKSFSKAIRYNKRGKITEQDNKTLKKLKLYFSYLMISLNIGLNITNLNVNYEKMVDFVVLANNLDISARQDDIVVDNPFSDNDSQSLVTSADAATNLIMEAFEKNPLINEEDLKIALSLEKYIESNPYFDYEELYDTFATLGIQHFNYIDYGDIDAHYNRSFNVANMFKGSYSSKNNYVDTLQHEIIHSTGNLDNQLLNEGMTSLLEMEFCDNGLVLAGDKIIEVLNFPDSIDTSVNNGYYDHILLVKIFCELITSEKMLEAYTEDDMSIIKEEMLKLNSDEESYNNLMNAMQEYSEVYRDFYLGNITIDSYEDTFWYQFYELLLPYLNSDKINEETKNNIMYYIGKIGSLDDVLPKSYFNKDIYTENDTLIISNPVEKSK